jgi:hypothetical protein
MRSRLLAIGLSSLFAALSLFCFIDPTPAYADSAEEPGIPSKSERRDGWIVGIGVLGGRPINSDCPDCYSSMGAGMDLQVGRMLSPRLALLLDTHGLAVGSSQVDAYGATANVLVQGVVAIAVQYWPVNRLWIKGGIGQGDVRGSATMASPTGGSVDVTETEAGLGFLAAAGFELYQGDPLGVSLHARYAGIEGAGLNRGNLLLGVGLAWYL